MLSNKLRREVIFELPRFHPVPTVPLPDMDDGVVERAQERVEQRAEGAALDTLLIRAREQVDSLAAAAAALEDTLPAKVGEAVRNEAQPVGRNLAEIRGLMNQVIRRLEHVDGDLLAERNARVDDLALLVELVTSGWKGVDTRLARLEAVMSRLEQGMQEKGGAIVYRMEDRRPDAASS
jgi:BMFP domain-containing protein YqiC